MEQRSVNWQKWFISGGMISGAALGILFLSTPRWFGDGQLANLILGSLIASAIYAGAVLGIWLQKRFGCDLNLHAWQDHDCPRIRTCRTCKREQRLYDPVTKLAAWRDVRLVKDEKTGTARFEYVSPASHS